jgi:uncharacterized repeat protein (TIGR03803 family)
MLRKNPFSSLKQLVLPMALAALPLALSGHGAEATPVLTVIHSFCATPANCPSGSADAQQLLRDSSGAYYGLTASGGAYGHGQAFKLTPSGGSYTFTSIYDFCSGGTVCSDGSSPEGRLIEDSSGNLYGMTAFGGTVSGVGCTVKPDGCGTIFELSPPMSGVTYTINTLWKFCSTGSTCPGGVTPGGGLTYSGWPSSLYNGSAALFGTTTDGGANSGGLVFKLTGVGGTPALTDLYDFCSAASCADGSIPDVPVIDSGSGTIYGVTHAGGTCPPDLSGCGVAWALTPTGMSTYSYATLWNFCTSTGCADGQNPNGQLLINSTGKLLGATVFGGADDGGVAFRITPAGAMSTESVRYNFCSVGGGACTDGDFPHGGEWPGTGNNLYGTTAFGGANQKVPGGTVWKLNGTTLTTLYSFCPSAGCADGNLAQEGVVYDTTSGDLLGTTTEGGANGGGVVFDLTP